MKKHIIIVVIIIASLSWIAEGTVYTNVFLSDSNTPLELVDANTPFAYQDIMVGTKLNIIVHSDLAEYWEGGLYITGLDRDYGILSGRDFNNFTLDWQGSRFESAGEQARVYDWIGEIQSGFDFYGDINSIIGDWFVLDYTAVQTGTCNVGFYDYDIDWFEPVYYLTFSHVLTRDFNSDTIVNFIDYAQYASDWKLTSGSNYDEYKEIDFNHNSEIDYNDFMLFTDFWLDRTEINIQEPNNPNQ